ncbi:MAG: hypothetical protein HYV67_03535 [Candidatus Taylorbacteria bacterium]|nr:hypothetical protein [Candidatus Taylorbacteria bacterium]
MTKIQNTLCINRTALLVLSVLLLLLLFGASVANAGIGLSVQPVKVLHTIKPGETVSGAISLRNESDEDVNVEVTVEDFIPAAGSINLQFIGRTEGVTTVRDWITIGGKGSFVFKKGESRAIPYSIKAPSKAEPGAHFGVVFFKATRLEEAGQLKIGTRVGVLIFVTVPGNSLQKGKILDFSGPSFVTGSPVGFTIKFENTGTVHFEPKGALTIANMFGKKVGEVPISGQVVLPTGVRDLIAQWDVSGFLLGRYTAALAIVDGEGNELTTKTVAFYAFPVWHLLGLMALIFALFHLFKFLRRRLKISVSLK